MKKPKYPSFGSKLTYSPPATSVLAVETCLTLLAYVILLNPKKEAHSVDAVALLATK